MTECKYFVIFRVPQNRNNSSHRNKTEMQPTDDLYYKYAGVIDSVVKKYAYVCPDIADDLLLQAQLIFCEACISYDPNHPNQASFETWLRRQLQNLTNLINKAASGPTHVKIGSKSAVPMSMIEEFATVEDNGPLDISDIASQIYVDDYAHRLQDSQTSEFPKEMLPYIKALKGDSLRVFKDFCAGKFDLAPRKFLTREKQKSRAHLNPIKIYRRVYIHEGWSLERVYNAWRGVCGIFSSYIKGTLPSTVSSQKFVSSISDSDEKERTKANWMASFKQRHGISYSTYRTLRKKGLAPQLGTSNSNLDLSYLITV